MASSYIDTLRGEFDPDQYHDDYREALEKVVQAKAEGVPLPESEEEEIYSPAAYLASPGSDPAEAVEEDEWESDSADRLQTADQPAGVVTAPKVVGEEDHPGQAPATDHALQHPRRPGAVEARDQPLAGQPPRLLLAGGSSPCHPVREGNP